MGTNYYVETENCRHCGRDDGSVHIGKSSGGWKFVFNFNGGRFYKSLDEMRGWIIGKTIRDEYGKKITRQAFWKLVAQKQSEQTHRGTGSHVIEVDGYEFIDSDFS